MPRKYRVPESGVAYLFKRRGAGGRAYGLWDWEFGVALIVEKCTTGGLFLAIGLSPLLPTQGWGGAVFCLKGAYDGGDGEKGHVLCGAGTPKAPRKGHAVLNWSLAALQPGQPIPGILTFCRLSNGISFCPLVS